jgi:hypothetical protein
MTGKAKKPPTDAEMKAKAIARWDNEGGAPVSGDVSTREHHHPKRPRDANQLAKRIVDTAAGEVEDREPEAGKDPAAVALDGRGGLKGAKGRAQPK